MEMNTVQLIEQSKRVFTNFEQVDNKLYRGKLSIQDKTAGIYYLNFNQEVLKKDFEELQYKHLAEEFYKQEENLQWNIYLLFINSDISDDLKLEILTDDKYARKLIFTDNEFIDYFELEKSQPSDLPDIVSNWKQELNSVGLQELYSPSSYDGIVRNFLNNTTPNVIENQGKSLEDVPVVEKIKSICLKENYREFPKRREFNFGSVNLFTGSNGVGKTSLLESIELILTGKTQRNSDKNESSNSITAILNDDFLDSYIHNNRTYKERGAKWYNRRLSEQGNQTYKSFNRFNFFNTDAAHQFSNSQEIGVINESLKEIILGEEYTVLKDKIQKIGTRLRTELNKTSKEIKDNNDDFQKNEYRIQELKSDKNFEAIKENIKSNISDLGYKITIDESNYSIASLFINEIKNEVDYILSNNWVTDYKRFLEVKKSFSNRIKLVSESKITYHQNIQDSNALIGNLQKVEAKLSKANSFFKYFEIENRNKIESIESDSEKIEAQLLIINSLKDLNNLELDIIKLKEESKTLPELMFSKESLILTNNDLLKELQFEVKKLQDNFSLNERLISELKNLGKEILKHKPDSDHCPLCEQQILHSELLLKLESEFTSDNDKSILSIKNEKIGELKEVIFQLEKDLKELKQYEIVVSNYLKNYNQLNLKEVNEQIEQILGKEQAVLEEKDTINKTLYRITSIGGTISEYSKLKNELSIIYTDIDITDKSILSQIINTLKQEINSNIVGFEKLKNDNIKIITDLNDSLKLKDFIDTLDEIETTVKSNETKIESLNFSFENLNRFINIPYDKNILEISKDLTLLNENLNTFRDIENSQNEIKKLFTINEEITNSLPNIKVLNSRLNKAVEILEKLSKNSEDAILEDFFNNNLIEIKDIFKTIHSPQEYANLEYKGNKLVLFKGDKEHEISEISTGQRAALVLSIFISLNRKLKNGPNILIFDDPVTFIDDFNALSFLDFLRYFIVKEKKQIFFATANKKFSTLFKKKFDFLGKDEFKEFQLER